jgi:HlyD family secretion protein
MLEKIRELYRLLDPAQRRQLLRLQVLVILMAIAEVASVMAIGPFMALVGDIQQLQGDGLMARTYQLLGFRSANEFLFTAGAVALVVLTLAAMISTFTLWRLSMYGAQVGADLGNRLYRHYLTQPWLFHAAGNSSQLTSKIAQECQRVAGGIIQPLMQINARLITGTLMAITLFIFNPWVAVIGLLLFGGGYWLLYKTVQRRLQHNGASISLHNNQRFKLMNEGFGGIKDTLLLGRQQHFIQRFTQANDEMARAAGNNQVLSLVPRYAMELLAFGAVIGLVLYLLKTHQGDLGHILPLLSIYALAGFKLLPALQQVYTSFTQVRGNIAALDNLHDDLKASRQTTPVPRPGGERWVPGEHITLQQTGFTYPGTQQPALQALNMRIPANSVVGLVGASGSGKSTTIDLLLGLITPDQGQLLVDGQPVSHANLRQWQNALGYVPQSIFLADASIAENIAFGLPAEQIDPARVERAAGMAHLDELLASLPQGLATRVGERGVQLSGGQRQRIGIARALYQDAQVLVLDEATSALDGITEKLVMDAIHDFAGQKTIIMIAHRLATVRQCDIIFLLEAGRVVDQGSYHELIERNSTFRRMAENA